MHRRPWVSMDVHFLVIGDENAQARERILDYASRNQVIVSTPGRSNRKWKVGDNFKDPIRLPKSQCAERGTGPVRGERWKLSFDRCLIRLNSRTSSSRLMVASIQSQTEFPRRRVLCSGTREDAALIGPATVALCESILENRPHPEKDLRACLGIVGLIRPMAPRAWKRWRSAPSRSTP